MWTSFRPSAGQWKRCGGRLAARRHTSPRFTKLWRRCSRGGDHYAGYGGTVCAGAAVLRAVDAAADPTGRAAADAGLHVSSAYEQATQWDDEPADDMDWQEQAVERLEGSAGGAVSRGLFAGLPLPPKLGVG